MADTFVISSIGATRVNTPPTASKPRRTSAREPRRASSRATSSISGRAGGCERTSTCQPGWASMQSTSTRAYAWIRGSTRGILVGCGEFEPDTHDRVRGTCARRMAGHGIEERVAPERLQLGVGFGLDRRRPPNVPEQGDLAERVAGPELTTRRAVHRYLEAAGFDDVEPIAVIALLDDCGARLRRQRPRAPPPSARG